jgi:hypothetical protein
MGLLDKVKETASQAKDAATKFADEKGISGGSGSIIETLQTQRFRNTIRRRICNKEDGIIGEAIGFTRTNQQKNR